MLPPSFQRHETKFALFMAWILSPCLITLLGFYLGTIFGDRWHIVDLQVAQIHTGALWAAIFFVATIVAAIVVTIVVPPVVERDYAQREEKWANRAEHH
ncbi:MAG: hypothetical protein P4L46_21200 [Fimbriimonas sp.]|nr:hypothetical protein [Fimbriimonas sp.]